MVAELFLPAETIFTILIKIRMNAISIKCDSIKFITQGEPLLGSKRGSG